MGDEPSLRHAFFNEPTARSGAGTAGLNLDSRVSLRKGLTLSDMDGEIVIVDPLRERWHAAGSTGSRILGLLDGERRGREIVAALLAIYDIDEPTCSEEVLKFLRLLQAEELLIVTVQGPT